MLFSAKITFLLLYFILAPCFAGLDSLISGERKKQAVEQVETSLMMFTETQLF